MLSKHLRVKDSIPCTMGHSSYNQAVFRCSLTDVMERGMRRERHCRAQKVPPLLFWHLIDAGVLVGEE